MNLWEGNLAETEASAFCEIWGVQGTVLLDETAEYADLLGIRGVPTNVFVDEHGMVQEVGAVTPDELERATINLLGSEQLLEPRAADIV